jgi:uncharacterized protein (DUF302 family)
LGNPPVKSGIKNGRGGEIRTHFDDFYESIENKQQSMGAKVFRVFIERQQNAAKSKSVSDDRKR